jgi:hypothetical protein
MIVVAHRPAVFTGRDETSQRIAMERDEFARIRGSHDEHAALTKRAVELAANVASGRVAKALDRLQQGISVDTF